VFISVSGIGGLETGHYSLMRMVCGVRIWIQIHCEF
jgi:hypothetical protein